MKQALVDVTEMRPRHRIDALVAVYNLPTSSDDDENDATMNNLLRGDNDAERGAQKLTVIEIVRIFNVILARVRYFDRRKFLRR